MRMVRKRRRLGCFALVLIVLLAGFVFVRLRRPPTLQAQRDWEPGTYNLSLDYDGETRTFWLHIPPGYDGTRPRPLVIGLHGGTGSGEQFEDTANMNVKADELGFIAVYPDGTGVLQTWNSGHCCGAARRKDVDDVGFIRALVAALDESLNLDLDRIYATGMSNGAILSHRLGAEASDLFAAIAPVAGTIGGQTDAGAPLDLPPTPAGPVSVLIIHGMQDEAVRYEGGLSGGVFGGERIDLSVAESVDFWLEHNACEPTPETTTTHDGNIIQDVYACAPEGIEVMVYTVVDGGHSWPGGDQPRRRADTPTDDLSATDVILEFFAAHPEPD